MGGSGLIGQELARQLVHAGHEVVILSRGQFEGERGGQVWRHWDGISSAALMSLIDGQNAIVNLVGESLGSKRWSEPQKERILKSRMSAGQAIVQASRACQHPPQVYVQASAVGFYGTGDAPMTEGSPVGTDWLASVCLKWETASAEITTWVKRVVIVRTGVVLAKSGGILQQMSLPMQFYMGGPIGTGNQWISWIHLYDEAAALRYLLENGDCQGIYNLAAPRPVQQRTFGKCLARRLHRPFWLPVPGLALKLLLGEMSILALEGQQVFPKRLQEAGFSFKYPELCLALQEIYPQHS
jgi:uncharacterized protein (TIGR01777 family)